MSQHQHIDRTYARRYERWALPFRQRSWAVHALALANRSLVWLFYLAYAVLLVLVVVGVPLAGAAAGSSVAGPSGYLPCGAEPASVRLIAVAVLALVPGVAFALLSAVRAHLNAPRPYERDGIVPLVPRDGSGRSLPSRHAFSAFAIAGCWWTISPVVASALFACACLLAALRVLVGVHYPRDVVVGALCGMAAGLCAAGLVAMLSYQAFL